MKSILKHIATIQTGLFAKPEKEGDVVYLQAKHFDDNGLLFASLHPDLKAKDISEKHLLVPGDILFSAKGTKNFATVYEKHNPPCVASTSFFVIRLTQDQILPEYVAWYLNSDQAQSTLKGKAMGTSIPSISKMALGELEISIPSIKLQKSVVLISSLRMQEKLLLSKLESLRTKQIQHQIFNAINK